MHFGGWRGGCTQNLIHSLYTAKGGGTQRDCDGTRPKEREEKSGVGRRCSGSSGKALEGTVGFGGRRSPGLAVAP